MDNDYRVELVIDTLQKIGNKYVGEMYTRELQSIIISEIKSEFKRFGLMPKYSVKYDPVNRGLEFEIDSEPYYFN